MLLQRAASHNNTVEFFEAGSSVSSRMPVGEGKTRKTFFSYKADSYLRDKFLAARTRQRRECCHGEGCYRALNYLRFVCVCSASLFQVLAPWGLCCMEVVAVLLVYLLGTSRPLVIHESPTKYHFSYMHSLEDVVGLSCTRSALLSISYAIGMQHMHRPYLYASYLLAATCFPYIIVKMILFRYSQDAVPAASIFILTGLFCWVHVFAARRTSEWARRRYQMGLGGFGYPWEEASVEEAWTMLRRPDLEEMTKCSDGGQDGGEDVPPEMLADDDSKFVEVAGLKVHYKEVVPSTVTSGVNDSVGVVLVHGFGGGVFAWRHIMEPLALQLQCRVVAFDRPAFGLTSRPAPTQERDNPYTMGAQAHMLLQLCGTLGLEHVILAAHADGCLLALRAASLAASFPRSAGRPMVAVRQDGRGQGNQLSSMQSGPVPGEAMPAGLCSGGGDGMGGASPLLQSATPSGSVQVLEGVDGGLRIPSESGASSSHDSHISAPTGLAAHGGPAHQSAMGLGKAGGMGIEDGAGCYGGIESIESLEPSSTTAAAATTSTSIGITEGTRHRRTQSMPGPVLQGRVAGAQHHPQPSWPQGQHNGMSRGSSGAGGQGSSGGLGHSGGGCYWPSILGVAMLHPNLSGQMGPALSRLLARSKMGRSILRPLLRTEVGEVSNRRAWHNTDKLTPEVLQLYKAPLRVEGWCESLVETTRIRSQQTQGDLAAYVLDVRPLPALVLTGEHDRIVPPGRMESLGAQLPHSRLAVVPDCGHLSHEESPGPLLEQLVLFCGHVLVGAHAKQQEQMQEMWRAGGRGYGLEGA